MVLVVGCGSGGDSDAGGSADSTITQPPVSAVATAGDIVELRPLSVSDDLRIVDDLDREVLLRGVNLNSLGEYWQGDPDHPPIIPVSDDDWSAMAEYGVSVVRLIVTWSRIEPEPGVIDEDYLDEVDQMVQAAADKGIYTVIDMHQDAYSAFISTEDESECAEGERPGKGWDGAPEWATITDGLSTCVTGDRNSAPAVVAAWNNFYDNTDGIRDNFVDMWGVVAERFAGRPEVAGYDILNEPEVSRPAGELTPLYDELMGQVIESIREGEVEAGAGFRQLIFIEPAIPAGDPTLGLVVPDPTKVGLDPVDIVAAPHNYAEVIDTLGLTIEETNELFISVATGLGVPVWVGEYGFWDTGEETLEKANRFAADQDARVLGGAWWQWRQGCGDPHSIAWGEPAGGDVVHLNVIGCPGDIDKGPNDVFLAILGRAYPRAAPGRITRLAADPATGSLMLEADRAVVDAELVIWSPGAGGEITVEGLEDVTTEEVPGGRIITARVTSPAYFLQIA